MYRTHVLLNFVSGFGHLHSMFCLVVGACGLEFAQAIHSSVHMDCVFHVACGSCSAMCFFVVLCCCTQLVFLSAACIHVMSCAV